MFVCLFYSILSGLIMSSCLFIVYVIDVMGYAKIDNTLKCCPCAGIADAYFGGQ